MCAFEKQFRNFDCKDFCGTFFMQGRLISNENAVFSFRYYGGTEMHFKELVLSSGDSEALSVFRVRGSIEN